MPLRNDSDNWGGVAKTLHWSMAGLVFVELVLGWMAVAWPLTPTKLYLFIWHKSLGFVILFLVLIRLVWRFSGPRPRFPDSTTVWERWSAVIVHELLYAMLIVLPITGWLFTSAVDVPFRFFGWFRWPALIPPDQAQAHFLADLHIFLGWSLVVLLSVHILAALWHHAVGHDSTLRRMMPGVRVTPKGS